jgi:hypothetical protein
LLVSGRPDLVHPPRRTGVAISKDVVMSYRVLDTPDRF